MAYEQFHNYGGDFQSDYFKVTNLSIIPCYMTWNKALLNDEQLEAYESYKTRPEYVGLTDEDRASRRKLPEAYKMRPFYEQLGAGIRFRVTDMVVVNKQPVTSIRYEYRFCIGPDVEELKRRGSLGLARWICDQYEVPFTREDTLESLAEKLRTKFGSNVAILSARQWNDSGLKNRERREIRLKLQPGESTPRITNEGYLVAEPMTDMDIEEWKEKGETYTPVTEVQLPQDKPNTEIEKLTEKMAQLEKMLEAATAKVEAKPLAETVAEVKEPAKPVVKAKANVKSKSA
jgi:hypothetical protein